MVTTIMMSNKIDSNIELTLRPNSWRSQSSEPERIKKMMMPMMQNTTNVKPVENYAIKTFLIL